MFVSAQVVFFLLFNILQWLPGEIQIKNWNESIFMCVTIISKFQSFILLKESILI